MGSDSKSFWMYSKYRGTNFSQISLGVSLQILLDTEQRRGSKSVKLDHGVSLQIYLVVQQRLENKVLTDTSMGKASKLFWMHSKVGRAYWLNLAMG